MKKQAAAVVHSKPFTYTMLALGLIFIVITYFIAVTPESFLKYGYFGIFLFNTISSGLLIFPMIVDKFNIPLVILASALGNVPNTAMNYLVGNTSTHMFSKQPLVVKLKQWVQKFGLFMVYILAILPLPLDVNALLSGYVGIPFKKYLLVNFLGKITLFALAAYGVISVQNFLEK